MGFAESGPLTLLKTVYPQFHPSNAGELRAVVLANRNAPVNPGCGTGLLSDVNIIEKGVLTCRYSKCPASSYIWKLDGPSGDTWAS